MALDSLREAVDSDWRTMWLAMENERLFPILKPLLNRPQYKAIVQEIKADLDAQLVRVRELEKNDPDWQ